MNQKATLIYDLKSLKLAYGDRTVLQIGNMQIHRGTVYGIIGPVGSGKSSLLNILAGRAKPTAGTLKYDNEDFKKDWLGRPKPEPSIYHSGVDELPLNQSVRSIIKKRYPKQADSITNQYFTTAFHKQMLTETLEKRTPGERAWLKMILAVESDPRVLLIDDYGIDFDNSMQQDFNRRLIRMMRELGTTIIMTAAGHDNIQNIASVLIYLDNGHICKIRPGKGRTPRNPRKQY
ncbi:MAG: ATP-binding cassette domain-containing protein [Candidatus Neomarinimicrobiota bacterium]